MQLRSPMGVLEGEVGGGQQASPIIIVAKWIAEEGGWGNRLHVY